MAIKSKPGRFGLLVFLVWSAIDWMGMANGATLSTQQSGGARQVFTAAITMSPGGSPVLEVLLETRLVARFLLDTGSSRSFITERLTTLLGSRRLQTGTPEGGPEYKIPGWGVSEMVRIQDLRFGGPAGPLLKDAPFTIIPGPHSGFLTRQDLDGIIGLNFLYRTALEIDPQERTFTMLVKGNLTAQELAAAGFHTARNASLTPKGSGAYVVTARLNGEVEDELGLDTGGTMTVISAEAARKLKLEPVRKDVPVHGLLGPIPHHQALLNSFSVGSFQAVGFPVMYLADEKQRGRPGANPTLGMDVLGRSPFLIDFPARKLYFKPALKKAEKKPE